MTADDERRLAWTHLLIGTEPKPKGSGRRARGKYIGALDQAWVKKTFGQGGKPLTGTALSYWRKKGIPLEHVPTMIEALRSLLPETEREAAPSMTRRLLTGVMALEAKAGVTPADLSSAEVAMEAALEADARLAAELEASRRKSSGQGGGQAGGQSAGSLGSKRQKP